MRSLPVLLSLPGLFFLFVFCFCGTALAEGFALYEYSARGIALGGAVMARKPDPSALAYNPALITRLPGKQLQIGASSVTPRGKMRTEYQGETQVTSLRRSSWVLPNFYYSQQISDKLFLGVGEFSRFGLGFEYPHNWPGRFNIYQVSLKTASVNPNIAWAATDKLSLAAGVEIMHLSLDIKKKTPLTRSVDYNNSNTPQIDSNIKDANSVGVGFNLAGHYQFTDQWAAGIAYRSQIRHRAKGTNQMTLENADRLPLPADLKKKYNKDHDAHGTVVLPDSIASGISWTPFPQLSVEIGAIWTKWSNFNNLRIHTDDVGVKNSNKDWRNAWRLNAGAEYRALDWLTLRAGYVYDQSPMTEQYEDYLVPTDGRHIGSAGLGFHGESWDMDLAYAYIHAMGRVYKGNSHPDHQVLRSRTTRSVTNIFSLSLTYRF